MAKCYQGYMLLGQNITDAECFELVESKQGKLLSQAVRADYFRYIKCSSALQVIFNRTKILKQSVCQVPAAEAAGAQL